LNPQEYFSLEEANQLLPWLKDKLETIYSLASDVAPDSDSGQLAAEIYTNGTNKAMENVSGAQKEKERAEKQIENILTEIQRKGIILRNIGNGLSDFPAFREGEEVFLCWTTEESSILYWHYRYEGYNGRKPI
jgi:hypothetical protein